VRSTTNLILGLAALAVTPCFAQPPALTSSARTDVIESIVNLMRTRYVSPDIGNRVAAQMLADLASGRWTAMTKPEEFAASVTSRLRELAQDGHLALDYSPKPLPADAAAAEQSFSAAEMERCYGAQINYGFNRLERLEGNIGYLDLRVFAPASTAGDVAASAMTFLAQSNALIIDLRNNGGGHGEMVQLLAGYLFNDARQLSGKYDRPTDTHTFSMTPAWVPGRRFGPDKPVYVLISRKTFSAAEGFAYDLKALQRVKVVGESSGGGAHPFEYRRVHDHFVLSLAEGRSINPITGGNWQGTGVQPDVQVESDRALETALQLARKDRGQRRP
jgi:hypothetical protein